LNVSREDGFLRTHTEFFVGREEEMALVKLAFAAAELGQGGIALFAGEIGTGKTTLARKLSTFASQTCQVYWGRCYENDSLPAFWPWVEIVRAYIAEHEGSESLTGWDLIRTYTEEFDAVEMRFELGDGASDLVEIVRDVSVALPDTRPAPFLEPNRARFRLMDSIVSFLKKLAARQTTVIIIDNLHAADGPSLQVLRALAEQLENDRILVLGTYRQPKTGANRHLIETLAALFHYPRCYQIAMRPFTFQEIRDRVVKASGVQPRPEFVRDLLNRTDGNPLYTVELCREKTVAAHVGNILSKTEAANRAEATAFAGRHGMLFDEIPDR